MMDYVYRSLLSKDFQPDKFILDHPGHLFQTLKYDNNDIIDCSHTAIKQVFILG